jgi:hypothetical protein
MEFLKQAEEAVKKLESRIAQLEKENELKEQEIRRLSVSGGSAPAASAAVAAAPAPTSAAPATSSTSVSGPGVHPKLGKLDGPRVKYVKKEPTPSEREKFTVYDDDPALGKKCPGMYSLKWFNGGPVEVGKGKPVVITFISKLNKGDFSTLSVLSELALDFEDKVQFCCISRDNEEADAEKFASKYHGKYFAELSSPDGSAGVTVYMTYPIAYDDKDEFNDALKKTMVKGTVGVGMVIVVDEKGIIRWYETFYRGVSPMAQIKEQIKLLLEGKPLLSNGKTPEQKSVEEELGDLPDEVTDPFKKTGKY